MKTVKITAPTDYFVICPYCGATIETNIMDIIINCDCGKSLKTEYDRDYFMMIAESNIHESKCPECWLKH